MIRQTCRLKPGRKKRLFLSIPLTIALILLVNFLTDERDFFAVYDHADSHTAFAFTDVNSEDYHYMAIKKLEENGIISGYDDGSFKSYRDINRAEALKIIILANGTYTEEEINDEFKDVEVRPFTDTPLSDWYTKYIHFAKEKGIIDGYDDGSFKPNNTINLAETLKIYLESLPNVIYPNPEGNLYEDVPGDSWYANYFAYAHVRGALDIQLTNEAYPNQSMSRGYLAEVIYRFKMFSSGYSFGKATFYGAAVQGNNTASGETFDMYEMTAAHKTLPFGTMLEVTNLANGKSVQVKITDRGPYGAGRVIDLTSAAFEEIAWLGTGIINVQYRVL